MKLKQMSLSLFTLFLFFCSSGIIRAEIRLPSFFSEHMVLQKSENVPVWGWGRPGEQVTVRLSSYSETTEADQNGHWKITLNLADSGPGPFELVIQGDNLITIPDVLIGEVWLCVGQSNMEMRFGACTDAKEIMKKTDIPYLRHFKVERQAVSEPADDVKGSWVKAVRNDVAKFSGAGFHFGRSLQKELNCPVGLVHSSWGGSIAETWTSRETLAELKPLDDYNYDTIPSKMPSYLFNGMLNPLIPYAFKGVIWYQGESNAADGDWYRRVLSAMLDDWRTRWQRDTFPFYFCQLANFRGKENLPKNSSWAEFREAQTSCLLIPNTGQAILIDIGEEGTVHPRNKKDVGERLARIALARDYNRNIVYSGPVFQSAVVADDKIFINFTNTDDGLLAKTLPDYYKPKSIEETTVPLVCNSPDSELEGFAICGQNKEWVWAQAKIEGDGVLVWSPEIAEPVGVRYAWSDNPTCNLYNGAGLPAGPFRTSMATTK